MTTRRYSLAAALAAGVAIAACGGEEAPKTPPPPPAPAKAPAPAATGTPVGCVAKWTTGASGKFTCEAAGGQKDAAKITADTLRLGKICVNDARLTTITVAGGKTVPLTLTASGPNRCGDVGGGPQLPETCNCTPPAGGDCTPPADGFLCIAAGTVP
jgi:hypothetical protein